MTQERLAEVLNVGVSTVRRWELGSSQPHPRQRFPLADALDVSLMGLDALLRRSGQQSDADSDPAQVTADGPGPTLYGQEDERVDAARRQFTISSVLAAVGFPSHIRELFTGPRDRPIVMGEIEAMRRAVDEFERRDATVVGDLVSRAAVILYDELGSRLRTTSVDAGAYRSLQGLHADIAAWVGWLSFDAGDLGRSRRYLSEAITHARMIGDVGIEVRSMSYYCLVLAREQRYTEMLQCAEAALGSAAPTRPTGGDKVTSLLHLRKASAHAWLGDRSGFDQGIGQAQSCFSDAEAEPVPLWLNFFNWSEVNGLRAFGMMSLGDHRQAASVFADIVADYDPAYCRNGIYYTAVLADAMRQVGDIEQASETAISVLPSAARLQSGRVAQVLRQLAADLAPYAEDVPSVRDFVGAYREVVR